MLLVKIELQSARTGQIKQLGLLKICNISGRGKGRYDKRADYQVEIMRKGTYEALRTGHVRSFPRLSYNVWRLVFRALKAVLPEEK